MFRLLFPSFFIFSSDSLLRGCFQVFSANNIILEGMVLHVIQNEYCDIYLANWKVKL